MIKEYWVFAISAAMIAFFGFMVGTTDYSDFFKFHQPLMAGILAFIGTAIGGFAIFWQFSQSEKRKAFENSERQRSIGTMLLAEINSNSNRLYHIYESMSIDGDANYKFLFNNANSEMFQDQLGVFSGRGIYWIFQFYEMKHAVDIILERTLKEIGKTPITAATSVQKALMKEALEVLRCALHYAEECHHYLAEVSGLKEMATIDTTPGIKYDDGK